MQLGRHLLALVLGVSVPVFSGCLIELDHQVACGDGYVDISAGEACDPGDPDSYATACTQTARPLGHAACDPVTCQIINTIDQCSICGDSVIDLDEECDSDNLGGSACIAGGELRCINCKFDRTGCNTCGNTVLDPGEECDFRNSSNDDLTAEQPCTALQSPYVGIPYGSGGTTLCNPDCTWNRNTCSYCGNNMINEEPLLLQIGGTFDREETCDGTATLDSASESSHCQSACNSTAKVRCTYTCNDICELEFPEELNCCLRAGEACPDDLGEPGSMPCCWSLDNPGEPIASACEVQNGESYCR